MTEKDRLYGEPSTRMRAMELAERVCVLYGWTGIGADDSDRAKALMELWSEWLHEFEASGGSTSPKDHPALSDERIAALAGRRRAHESEMRALVDQIVVEVTS